MDADAEQIVDTGWDWLGIISTRILIVVGIVIAALICLWLLQVLARRVTVRVMASQRKENARDITQRAQTVAGIVESTGQITIFIIAIILILSNIGIDIAPLLAGAGIVGLAIAFGAQSLIKDFFQGFFILLEDQYAVGDFVRMVDADVSGTVEDLTLRRTVLRSAEGGAITVPNGEVRTVENLSKDWSRAIVEVDVAPDADDAQVIEIFHQVLDTIQDDPEIGDKILEVPVITGLMAVTANQLTYRALVKTLPSEQWAIGRALRLRLRNALIEAGVPMPPRTVDVVAGP